MSNKSLPELLLPAGSPESLEASIEGGADAVYFGASAFSARARAVNFTDSQIESALALCRTFGVKAYCAVNTKIRDGELERAMELIGFLRNAGTDAIICADLGLASLIRERFPDVELHASTQLTPTFLSDAHLLKDLGFSRMVAPREISGGELRSLCENSPIEIEAFIHGAHCVSLSGQCLMSSMIGGRSANRGECAQPCRLPYKRGSKGGYLLSLADMCYAPDIPGIIESGAASLKIEGRQKNADYVYGVCKVYRRLLDEGRSATPDEIEYMASLFQRGFTDGYFRRSYGKMTGVRREDATVEKVFGSLTKTVPVSATLTAFTGEKARLELAFCDSAHRSVTVSSEDEVLGADISPLTEERARASVSKLGYFHMELRDFRFISDGKGRMSLSQINDMRRRCATALITPDIHTDTPPIPRKICEKVPHVSLRTAEFLTPSQIPDEAFEYFDEIYLPYTKHHENCGISFPPYLTDECAARLEKQISPGDRVLVHTPGQFYFAVKLGALVRTSFRFNIYNEPSINEISLLGAKGITLSPEIPLAAMRDMAKTYKNLSAVVYGKLPLMHTVRCMLRDTAQKGECRGCGGYTGKIRSDGECRAYFTDRVGAKFFVCGELDCTNTLYNSVVLWAAEKIGHISSAQLSSHFIFTDEAPEAVSEVLRAYREGSPPNIPVRRVK